MLGALSPIKARGSWGTSCARHGPAYTVWWARAVDGSYSGDVHASRHGGRISLCTVVRVPGWSTAWRGVHRRAHIVGKRRTLSRRRRFGPQGCTAVIGSTHGGGHRLPARRAAVIFGSPRGGRRWSSAPRVAGDGGHRLPARRAAVVIGSPRGGRQVSSASGPRLQQGRLWLHGLSFPRVLRNDRTHDGSHAGGHGSQRPAATVTQAVAAVPTLWPGRPLGPGA